MFNALARRYGLKRTAVRGQHQQTVMLRVSKKFANDTSWPEYTSIAKELHQFLHDVTDRVIREALDASTGEADEVAALGTGEKE